MSQPIPVPEKFEDFTFVPELKPEEAENWQAFMDQLDADTPWGAFPTIPILPPSAPTAPTAATSMRSP